MGLEYDNEAVSQFDNKDRHIEVAKELLAKGQAYECYCTPEELEEMREKAKAEGSQSWYDRRWRDAPADAPKPEGVNPVIRIKAPVSGETTIHDEVQGDVTVKNEQIDDFILLRSDGTPTYMLAVVVDDHDMGVTHVIRGDDHLNNVFRQNVIYDALDWDKPVYAHLPLILGPDGAKLSKRHGAQSVEDLKDMGYLPEAVLNYLMRLGWSHGDDEIFSIEQIIAWFDIKDVNKSAAKFDFAKLDAINTHYIAEADNDRLAELLANFVDAEIDDLHQSRLAQAMDELKGRASTLKTLAEDAKIYLQDAPFAFDEKALKLLDEDGKETLKGLLHVFENLDSFEAERIEAICREYAKEHKDGKLGKVMMPLRGALTGTDKSPSLFHAMAIIGKEETCARIRQAL